MRDLLIPLERWIGGLCLFALLALALVQIVARNFFDAGIPVADTLTRYLVLYVTFFGATLAVHAHRHIKIDVICACLSECWLARLHRPIHFLGAVICGLFCQAGIVYWRDEWQYAGDHERWMVILSIVIPIGFGLLAVHFLLSAILGYHEREDHA